MKTNPGGQLAIGEIFGREKLISDIWRFLDRQSLILSAERRMGKTHILRKMQAEAPPTSLLVYRDLEGIHSPLEFVEAVFHDVESHLSAVQRTAEKVRGFLAHLAGGEIGGVIKFPESIAPQWKTLLTKTLEDLADHQTKRLVFLWDEMPFMLHNIKARIGPEVAMALLDTLRALRQTHPNLRMIFTGSIGLHNVIDQLKRAGYANDPTNDMKLIDVPPLSEAAATELAVNLLSGEGIPCDNPSILAKHVSCNVDHIAFYVHHIIDQLALRAGPASITTVDDILLSQLTDAHDPWHLHHYRSRLDTYYTPDECKLVLIILDVIAGSDVPLSLAEIFNHVKAQIITEDAEATRSALVMLQRDHYLVQNITGAFAFRFPLIRRWWRFHRGIKQ